MKNITFYFIILISFFCLFSNQNFISNDAYGNYFVYGDCAIAENHFYDSYPSWNSKNIKISFNSKKNQPTPSYTSSYAQKNYSKFKKYSSFDWRKEIASWSKEHIYPENLTEQSRKNLFFEFELYCHTGYRDLLKTFHEYAQMIIELDSLANKNSKIQWALDNYLIKSGFFSDTTIADFIKEELPKAKQKIRNQKLKYAKQKKINEEAKRKELKRKALQKQQAKIKKKQPVQNYFLKRKNEIKSKASRTFYRNKNRAFAIRKAVDNNFKIFCQQYQLSKQAIGILNQNHIDTRIFEECIGNSIQQQLHSEFIDVLNKGADTYTAQDGLTGIAYLANNNWYATLAKVSFIGSHVNNIGQYTLAYKIADICDGIHRIVKNSTHNSLKNIHDNSVKINDIWRVAIQCVGRATQKAGNAVVDFTQGVEQKAIARPARFLTEFAYTLENNPEAVFTAASTVLLESVNYLFDSAQLIGTITNNPLSEKTIELLVEFEQNWVEPLCKKVSHAAKVFWKMPPKEKTQELVALGVQALAIVGATKLVAALPAQVMLLKTSALLQLDKLSRISEPILQTVILPDGRATITIQAVECMSEELVAAAEQTIAVAVSTNVGLVMPVAVDTVSTAMLAMKNGPPYQRKTKIAREKASKIRKRKIRPSEEIVQEYKNLAETKVEWQGSYDLSEVENISIPQKIKFSKKSLEHAFSGKVEKLPGNGPLKISGYHSDFQGKALSKSGMNMSKIKDYKTGAFDAKIRLCGKIRKKTMFPESWRPQKVLDTTCNALKNVTKIKKLDYGRLRYVGRSDCGIEIEVITEFNGEVITFYPKLSL